MKKVGVITHYYKSLNYGGNFQAFALVKFLRDNGFDAEQIPYDRSNDWPFSKSRAGLLKKLKRLLGRKKARNAFVELSEAELDGLEKRKKAISDFNNGIPHSRIFEKRTLKDLSSGFDAFVVGSDQVWHPKAVCSAYMLDFDTGSAKKVSYAASFAVDEIPDEAVPYYKRCLSSFDAISVREKSGIGIVDSLVGQDAVCTVDPTLLLPRAEWEKVCEPIELPKKYVFCYFLSPCTAGRRSAFEYARSDENIKIVTLPYVSDKLCGEDADFGDVRLFDVSPGQLLTVIKNADAVFTDSFHMTVFSLIFEKEFFTFGRTDYSDMGSRLQTLLSMFDAENRFFGAASEDEIDFGKLQKLNYDRNFEEYEKAVRESVAFLKDGLN